MSLTPRAGETPASPDSVIAAAAEDAKLTNAALVEKYGETVAKALYGIILRDPTIRAFDPDEDDDEDDGREVY